MRYQSLLSFGVLIPAIVSLLMVQSCTNQDQAGTAQYIEREKLDKADTTDTTDQTLRDIEVQMGVNETHKAMFSCYNDRQLGTDCDKKIEPHLLKIKNCGESKSKNAAICIRIFESLMTTYNNLKTEQDLFQGGPKTPRWP
jgi:hypothetical protein